MRLRLIAAAIFAVVLAVAASSAAASTSSRDTRAAADKITVWLQNDAESGWPEIVAAATKEFQAKHPGVDVDVQYQTWGTHLTKFDAALAGGDAPDVIEMGNTEMTKYMAAGAFRQLTRTNYPNAKTWLQGLAASCTYNGKTYGVPYYAGSRAVIYRKDMYRKAGIKKLPTSLAEFNADGKKLMKRFGKDRNFSALYFPGKYWYASMSFVYDYGGKIAVQSGGKWKGALNSPQALAGLNALKATVKAQSRANKTGDEANPQQALVFAKGKVASFIGNGWEWPYALDTKLGNPALAPAMGAYPMPSHTPGKYMPSFLEGSDLAIPITSKNVSLAADWIKAFTSTGQQRALATQGKVIPNTTTLAAINASNPQLAPFAKAAKFSWFVPTTPNWANVENADVLQNMLVSIFTGRASVQKAANSASSQITRILNSGS
ncbi:MAG TPA: extracellular solute-binding protein [Gaiellaceae bacterium]